MKEIKITKQLKIKTDPILIKYVTKLGKDLASCYDKQFLELATQSLNIGPRLKVIGYKKVKVPVYFEIDVPVTEKHYNEDGEYEGMLTRMEKKRLFRIGTRIEEEPIYEKLKQSKVIIKFRRYSPLVQKKIIKKQINKLKIK